MYVVLRTPEYADTVSSDHELTFPRNIIINGAQISTGSPGGGVWVVQHKEHSLEEWHCLVPRPVYAGQLRS